MSLDATLPPRLLGFVGLYLFAGIGSLLLAGYVWRNHGRDPIGRVFALLSLSLSVWVLGTMLAGLARFALEPDLYLAAKLFKFLGVSTAPVLFLVFTLLYDGRSEWVTARGIAALSVVPAATLPIAATTRVHGLFYDGFHVTTFAGMDALYVTVGPWFVFQMFYAYALLVAGSVLVVHAGVARWPYYRFETAATLLGLGVSWAVNLVYVFRGWPHPAVDPTPIGLVVTAVLFAVGVFSSRLMDIPLPVRVDVFDAIDDAIIVLDGRRTVAATNAAARELLAVEEAVGRPATDVLPVGIGEATADPVVETAEIDGRERLFKHRKLTIGGADAGWSVVVLTDITEEMETQRLRTQRDSLREENEKLEVLNRIVSHDIRNDMNVLLGMAGRLERTGAADEADLATIVDRGEHVVELTNTVETLMQTLLDRGESTGPVDLAGVLSREIEDVRAVERRVEVRVPEGLPAVEVLADELLGPAFRNLMTNAVDHSDRDEPTLTVTVASAPDVARVRIADDGPGIPEERKQSIFGRGEKGLESPGVGLGLYLVDAIVERYGGDVRVEDNEPRGSVFVVELPRADGPAGEAGTADAGE